jgi:hypothetical protein
MGLNNVDHGREHCSTSNWQWTHDSPIRALLNLTEEVPNSVHWIAFSVAWLLTFFSFTTLWLL